MTTTAPTDTSVTTQIYRVFIKASPQAIWDAITTPEWTQRYGYGLRDMYELHPGGRYRGYATEAMRAVLGWASDHLSAPEVRAIIDHDNA